MKNQSYFLTVISLLFVSVLTATLTINSYIATILTPIIIIATYKYPSILISTLIFILIFRNLLLGFFADLIQPGLSFNIGQALDFYFLSCCVFLAYLSSLIKNTNIAPSANTNKLKKTILASCIIIFIYYIYGIFSNGFSQSTTYLRFFIYSFACIYLTSKIAHKISIRSLNTSLFMISILATTFIFFEFLFSQQHYNIFNSVSYFQLKGASIENAAELAEKSTRRLFNSSFFNEIMVTRPFGLTYHSISGGYVLAVLGIYFFSYRRYLTLIICSLGVLISGSKGPILIIIMTLASYSLFNFRLYRAIIFPALSILVPCALVIVGLNSYDPHAYSLISSILNIQNNLIGKGLGFGGSLTTGTNYSIEIGDLNGDSGGALLLNMFGVIGIFLYALFFITLYRLYCINKTKHSLLLFLAGYFTLINASMQEEGFSPYSIGLISILLGIHVFSGAFNERNKNLL